MALGALALAVFGAIKFIPLSLPKFMLEITCCFSVELFNNGPLYQVKCVVPTFALLTVSDGKLR